MEILALCVRFVTVNGDIEVSLGFFNFDLKKAFYFLIIIALPLISINIEQNPGRQAHWFNQPLTYLKSASQTFVFDFSSGVTETTRFYIDLIDLKKRIQEVENENKSLRTNALNYQEVIIENNRLRQLLEFKSKTKMELKAAQVIARDPILDHNTITINKGSEDGVKPGMAVLAIQGAVGYILKAEAQTSHVMLITDRYSVVDAIIQHTRAQGLVEGRSQGRISLQYVDRLEDVQVGDLVVTGGLDNIFPKGFPIATITEVERKTQTVSPSITLKAIVTPQFIEEVFVVFNAAQEDFLPPEVVSTPTPEVTSK